MASLIPKTGVLVNIASQAPAPLKDYCQVLVTWNEVIFRMWKISLRNDQKVNPSEVKNSYQDFLYDERTQSEINRVFGKNTLDYLKRIANSNVDYLPRLPQPLLLKIIRSLEFELEDISSLSCVSKQFRELCQSDELWERIYMDHSGTHVTDDLRSLADAIGWRKLFFTNKLQLQMQLRRQKQKAGEPGDLPAFLTDSAKSYVLEDDDDDY